MPIMVRTPVSRLASGYSRAASADWWSGRWIVVRSTMARPTTVVRVIGRVSPTRSAVIGGPGSATFRIESPSTRYSETFAAPHNRDAFRATASRTGWRSVGRRLMSLRDLGGRGLLLQRLPESILQV